MCCWRQKAPCPGLAIPAPNPTSSCTELPLCWPRTHLGDEVSLLPLPTHCPMHKCDRGLLGNRKRVSVGERCSEKMCSQCVF